MTRVNANAALDKNKQPAGVNINKGGSLAFEDAAAVQLLAAAMSRPPDFQKEQTGIAAVDKTKERPVKKRQKNRFQALITIN